MIKMKRTIEISDELANQIGKFMLVHGIDTWDKGLKTLLNVGDTYPEGKIFVVDTNPSYKMFTCPEDFPIKTTPIDDLGAMFETCYAIFTYGLDDDADVNIETKQRWFTLYVGNCLKTLKQLSAFISSRWIMRIYAFHNPTKKMIIFYTNIPKDEITDVQGFNAHINKFKPLKKCNQ
jgi:hypothetical protein